MLVWVVYVQSYEICDGGKLLLGSKSGFGLV